MSILDMIGDSTKRLLSKEICLWSNSSFKWLGKKTYRLGTLLAIFSVATKIPIRFQNRCLLQYTYLQNKRMRRCGVAPPPIIFERLKLPQQIIYRRKENLSESPNHQKYWENILVSRFYEQFSRNRRNLGHFRKFEKISNSQNMNILYIILKHVIWRFQIYDLFREIFKFREDKSNNVFREIRKCFRKTPKFEFFAKQIIYLESPDHPLQNDT